TTTETISNYIEVLCPYVYVVDSNLDDSKNSSVIIQHPIKIFVNELSNFAKKYFLITGVVWP
ncbi:1749_t:CDS:2, partial [Gigaspora rosea]